MKYSIIQTIPAHLRLLADKLSDDDLSEIIEYGWSAHKALFRAYRASILNWTIFVDGEIAVIWGIAGTSFGNVGTIWMLNAPIVRQMPLAFVRDGRKAVDQALRVFPRLQGVIAANQPTRFLEMLGFSVFPAIIPLGSHNRPFRSFYRDRDEVVEDRMIRQVIEAIGVRCHF